MIQADKVYREAGASGLFFPGLVDDTLIEQLCASVALAVNVMMSAGLSPVKRLAALGVSRLSYGASSYIGAMNAVGEQAGTAFASK